MHLTKLPLLANKNPFRLKILITIFFGCNINFTKIKCKEMKIV